ncbi:hypothetical protein U3A55_12085 [Salarchaeum sp. III]|uniref:hypothetical protein n=1 Tax=Salarchaeum sp. III TaxID=3107927 RepID=UPI002EDA4FE3
MSNDYLAVFLYRWDDSNDVRSASTVSFGEKRQIKQHYPSTVIGVATRPVGETIDHTSCSPDFEPECREEFEAHVEHVADDVRWFETALDCEKSTTDASEGGA